MNKISISCAMLGVFLSGAVLAIDLEKAKEIYGPCAACHGALGAGGKRGEYPRIAGQPAKFLEQQLKAFRNQSRLNLPMYPYTKERELPDEDLKLVSAYLEQIELSTAYPVFKDSDDALARLQAMEEVMIIPRVNGDIEKGRAIYQKACAVCHGKTGLGRAMFPRLVGQYTSYLGKQIDAYLKAERPHDEEGAREGVLYTLKPDDIQDVLAYLTSIQEAAK